MGKTYKNNDDFRKPKKSFKPKRGSDGNKKKPFKENDKDSEAWDLFNKTQIEEDLSYEDDPKIK